jgi:phosphoribosyl 1,2-cyclic phosphodiesterase
MLIKFWGVHGSLPRPGPSTLKFGGNTACVEIRCGNLLLILDAGSGIRELGEDLLIRCRDKNGNRQKIVAHIFFSHLHWDHVQGFPFFAPLFTDGNEFYLYSGKNLNANVYGVMKNQMAPPHFPISLDSIPASLHFSNLDPGDTVILGDCTIHTRELNHPGGSYGYRIEKNGKVVVYATDTEHVDELDDGIMDLARDGDILIFDSMFTPDQYTGKLDNQPRRSWGHSTWQTGVELAIAAGCKRLVLFHHGNADDVVEQIQNKARKRFSQTTAACEGLELEL